MFALVRKQQHSRAAPNANDGYDGGAEQQLPPAAHHRAASAPVTGHQKLPLAGLLKQGSSRAYPSLSDRAANAVAVTGSGTGRMLPHQQQQQQVRQQPFFAKSRGCV